MNKLKPKNVVCITFVGSRSNQKKVMVGVSLGFSNCAKLLPSQSDRVLGYRINSNPRT